MHLVGFHYKKKVGTNVSGEPVPPSYCRDQLYLRPFDQHIQYVLYVTSLTTLGDLYKDKIRDKY